MEELIQVSFKNERPTVSARDLHEALEIRTRFVDWFPRMCEYGFCEGTDFNLLKNEKVQVEGKRLINRELLDYQMTIDMAKQICMLQRTTKGKLYRQYFLNLEKAWNTPEQVMARALQIANETRDQLSIQCRQLGLQVLEQQKQIKIMEPKASYADIVLLSDSLVLVTQIAGDYGVSPQVMNKKLHELGIQHKVRNQWILYSKYKDKGLAKSTTFAKKRPDGTILTRIQTEWTQAGRMFIYEKLKEQGIFPIVERR